MEIRSIPGVKNSYFCLFDDAGVSFVRWLREHEGTKAMDTSLMHLAMRATNRPVVELVTLCKTLATVVGYGSVDCGVARGTLRWNPRVI